MLVCSGLLHVLFLGGLILANLVWSKPVYYTGHKIYTVNLVTLPARMSQPKRSQARVNEPYLVVSKKEAARPDQKTTLAITRTPKLVSEKPDTGPAALPSFETGTPGVRLDLEEFEFPYYLAAVQRKIQQNLNVPRLAGIRTLQTVIYFKIGRNGRIYDTLMERSSNNPVFDLAAQRALEWSDPLPPLPDDFDHEYLGVHFEFEYNQ